jgi:hypothetical protein
MNAHPALNEEAGRLMVFRSRANGNTSKNGLLWLHQALPSRQWKIAMMTLK